ncbi:hypothetical protein FHL15_010336 [Xylaria flabelliformis]|uniref:Uncharacterized protein n=1 Tax=Xylaria flabelliformis TaxID=2512241 RepID=A0A553HLI1_9PEZI|nr:hypothetical protein FHL15_010336 [Xylaria flabelliformis]
MRSKKVRLPSGVFRRHRSTSRSLITAELKSYLTGSGNLHLARPIKSDRDCCHWHQWWNSRGDKAHANARRAKSRRRQQRRRGYISPYHESPVDLEKYDDDMDKLNADAACWVNGYDQCRASEPKKPKTTSKIRSRPLATGCAANFELFGDSITIAFRK